MSNLQVIENNILDVADRFTNALADPSINFDREFEFAMAALRSNEKLYRAATGNAMSLKDAIVSIASLGLSLNTANKHAYLVPHKNQVVLYISYMGLCHLATKSEAIKSIHAELVYQSEVDTFQWLGGDSKPIHHQDLFGGSKRGEIVGAYAYAITHDGHVIADFVDLEYINKVKNASQSSNDNYSPWKAWKEQMYKKTAIRNLAKTLPKGIDRLNAAIDYSNRNGEGIPQAQEIDYVPMLEHIETINDYNQLGAYWKSINGALPAKTVAREEVKNAVIKRKEKLQNIVDAEVKEGEAA